MRDAALEAPLPLTLSHAPPLECARISHGYTIGLDWSFTIFSIGSDVISDMC